MILKNWFAGIAVVAAMVVMTGCIDNSVPENKEFSVPAAAGEPTAWGNGAKGGVTGLDATTGLDDQGFGVGAGEGSVGGDSLNGWTVVEGVDFPVIYFDFDKDEVKASEMEKIQQVATYMANYPELGLIIEGHTDDVGTNEYNRALGERRAISTMNAFGANGLGSERIQTISYGEDRPAANGTDNESRALNRRAMLLPAKMK